MAVFSGIPDYSEGPVNLYTDREHQGLRFGGSFMFGEDYLPADGSTTINVAAQITYRGRLLGEYVYSVGSPPVGATDIVAIG